MKSFREHLAEATYALDNPVPGDAFDIELTTGIVIETVVTEINESGDIMIHLDETAMAMLDSVGMLTEMKSEAPDPAGIMSPLGGDVFLPYDEKKDPRTWMRKDVVSGDEEEEDEKSEDHVNEAKYHGREVPLGKPMQGDVKKSKVYVRKPNGNIVKVNFGDKTMRIKKSNPARRKNFRARHNCANPGPRWKARYWSCRAW